MTNANGAGIRVNALTLPTLEIDYRHTGAIRKTEYAVDGRMNQSLTIGGSNPCITTGTKIAAWRT